MGGVKYLGHKSEMRGESDLRGAGTMTSQQEELTNAWRRDLDMGGILCVIVHGIFYGALQSKAISSQDRI